MKPTEDTETFVKLVTASGLPEADLWKALLETAGITVYLRNEGVGSIIGLTNAPLGTVDLWVPRDEAARAMEVLQDERVQAPEWEEEQP
ncbi:MAG: DUF2007 domain-containing protein [Chloroflexi bacterium]|nr:MAG: DUF2007 domain-containing protein [Chloroflexota bacterium]